MGFFLRRFCIMCVCGGGGGGGGRPYPTPQACSDIAPLKYSRKRMLTDSTLLLRVPRHTAHRPIAHGHTHTRLTHAHARTHTHTHTRTHARTGRSYI